MRWKVTSKYNGNIFVQIYTSKSIYIYNIDVDTRDSSTMSIYGNNVISYYMSSRIILSWNVCEQIIIMI